jgi:predicted ATPase
MAHSRMPAVSARRASPPVAAYLKPFLRGELLLRQGPRPTWEEAEACFQQALAIARQQQAQSWELRAAMSLARLWQCQGKRTEARELLATVYGWFNEGFDTADLQDAKKLLDELAG